MAAPSVSDPAAARAEKTVESLLSAIEAASWFAALGDSPTPGETEQVSTYLASSDHPDVAIFWEQGWDAARALLQRTDWDRDWWRAEQAEQARLLAAVKEALGEALALTMLTRVTDLAARLLHGPAAVAAARAGIADPGLVRVAAGSAAQACYQMALARIAAAAESHPFIAKFRLFEAGRWPLVQSGGRFHIF